MGCFSSKPKAPPTGPSAKPATTAPPPKEKAKPKAAGASHGAPADTSYRTTTAANATTTADPNAAVVLNTYTYDLPSADKCGTGNQSRTRRDAR
ncbi:hypothetical protein N0V90_009780 [Kalmusia sp. IMI 367209]|nr:hypothetical protein N0V90_009780 [Kalmusia sp. IMI 367209]